VEPPLDVSILRIVKLTHQEAAPSRGAECDVYAVCVVAVLLVLSSQPIGALTTLGDGRQSREVHGSPPTHIE